MTGPDANRPLLQSHRRKLIVGASLLSFCALVALFPQVLSSMIGTTSWVVELIAVGAFVVLIYWLASGMKCPACRVNLFWYGLGRAKYGNWLEWLLTQSSCPKCGHKESR